MKRTALLLLSILALAAAFVAGAVGSLYFVANPMLERSLSHEREMFSSQVIALRRVHEGSTTEVVDYLRAKNLYGLALIGLDSEENKKTKRSQELQAAIAQACEDLSTAIEGTLYSGKDREVFETACKLARRAPLDQRRK